MKQYGHHFNEIILHRMIKHNCQDESEATDLVGLLAFGSPQKASRDQHPLFWIDHVTKKLLGRRL